MRIIRPSALHHLLEAIPHGAKPGTEPVKFLERRFSDAFDFARPPLSEAEAHESSILGIFDSFHKPRGSSPGRQFGGRMGPNKKVLRNLSDGGPGLMVRVAADR